MRIVVLVAVTVAALAMAKSSFAQSLISLNDPLWLQQAERHWYDEQIASGRSPASLVFGLDDSGSTGSYGKATLYELQRLFDSRPGDDEPNWHILRNKAILALPFLRRGNGLQMLFRPQGDLYATYAKRLTARRLDLLGKVDAPPGAIAVDTHVHTCFSHDSLADPTEMIRIAARRGLAGIAITDHNTMEGARKAAEALPRLVREGKIPASFFVIPGEEISSTDGHIIGLFLKREIAPRMGADRTIDEIHAQGGIAIAAHPRLDDGVGGLANTLPFDAVETCNGAEDLHFILDRRGEPERVAFYAAVTRPRIGASDAHDPAMVATNYTLLQGCAPNVEAVRAAILAGRCSAVSRDDDLKLIHSIRSGLPRMVFTFNSLFGSDVGALGMLLKKATGADQARVTLLPQPWVFVSKRF
ncbi:MAG TPA: PHP domain-containing protein [Armatimonadota bacterium]